MVHNIQMIASILLPSNRWGLDALHMEILSYLYNANKNIKILCKEAKLVANGNRVQTDLIIVCLQQLTKSLEYFSLRVENKLIQ